MRKEPIIAHARPIAGSRCRVALAPLTLMIAALTLPAWGCATRPMSPPPARHSALSAGSEPALHEVETTAHEVQSRRTASTSRSASGSAPAIHSRESERVRVADWRFAGQDGRLITTSNYRIHTTTTRSDFLHRLPMFYEAVLVQYRTAFGHLPPPPEPLVTYLFQNRTQWQAKTQEMLPEQAGIFGTLGRGGYTTGGTAVLYYIDHPRRRGSPDTFAIAAHEGWHQYTQTTFKHHLPIWLEEGIATYMEGFRLGPDGSPVFEPWANAERRAALADAVRMGNLIPLAELVRRSPQSFLESGKHRLLTYYAQVWALTRFLMEWDDGHYRPALEQVLQDAAEGRLVGRLSSSNAITSQRRRTLAATSRSGPWLILEYFNRDFAQFEDQYMQYVNTLTQRGR